MSNAERQQRFRDRRKQELDTLRAVVEEQPPKTKPAKQQIQSSDRQRQLICDVLHKLAKEIDIQRKANHEKRKAIKWNPDNIVKLEQKQVLDWIELELSKLIQLMASPLRNKDFEAGLSKLHRLMEYPDKGEARKYLKTVT